MNISKTYFFLFFLNATCVFFYVFFTFLNILVFIWLYKNCIFGHKFHKFLNLFPLLQICLQKVMTLIDKCSCIINVFFIIFYLKLLLHLRSFHNDKHIPFIHMQTQVSMLKVLLQWYATIQLKNVHITFQLVFYFS